MVDANLGHHQRRVLGAYGTVGKFKGFHESVGLGAEDYQASQSAMSCALSMSGLRWAGMTTTPERGVAND